MKMLETALPVFVALALGWLCRKKKLLGRDGIRTLKNVAVNLTLPAVLFSSFATADYAPGRLLIPLIMFGLCAGALALGFLLKKLLRIHGRLFPFLVTGFEAGMLGYGLFALLYPENGSEFAILDLGQVLFVFTVYKALLGGRGSIRTVVHDAVSSPVLWAILLGVCFGASGLYHAMERSGAASVLQAVTGFIAAPTSCLILLSIGYDLEFKGVPWKNVLLNTGLRLMVMALIYGAFVLTGRLLPGARVHSGALLLMVSLPAPYVLPVFTDAADERAVISSTLSFMTLLSLAAFALMAAGIS